MIGIVPKIDAAFALIYTEGDAESIDAITEAINNVADSSVKFVDDLLVVLVDEGDEGKEAMAMKDGDYLVFFGPFWRVYSPEEFLEDFEV